MKLEDVGNLNMYLIVANMYPAGLVQLLTFENMGAILCILKAGGIKGLSHLGYLSTFSKPTVHQAVSAFQKYYEDVKSWLTPDEVQNLPWNTIVAEHTLCKYSRMFKKDFYV